MVKRIFKKSAAWQDLLGHVDFISRDHPDAAERFIDSVEATFELLAENPLLGTLCRFNHPAAKGLRRWTVRGFKNYVVFYRSLSDGIEVVRLLHAARDAEEAFDEPKSG
jgi:toxin ParE1/3/4